MEEQLSTSFLQLLGEKSKNHINDLKATQSKTKLTKDGTRQALPMDQVNKKVKLIKRCTCFLPEGCQGRPFKAAVHDILRVHLDGLSMDGIIDANYHWYKKDIASGSYFGYPSLQALLGDTNHVSCERVTVNNSEVFVYRLKREAPCYALHPLDPDAAGTEPCRVSPGSASTSPVKPSGSGADACDGHNPQVGVASRRTARNRKAKATGQRSSRPIPPLIPEGGHKGSTNPLNFQYKAQFAKQKPFPYSVPGDVAVDGDTKAADPPVNSSGDYLTSFPQHGAFQHDFKFPKNPNRSSSDTKMKGASPGKVSKRATTSTDNESSEPTDDDDDESFEYGELRPIPNLPRGVTIPDDIRYKLKKMVERHPEGIGQNQLLEEYSKEYKTSVNAQRDCKCTCSALLEYMQEDCIVTYKNGLPFMKPRILTESPVPEAVSYLENAKNEIQGILSQYPNGIIDYKSFAKQCEAKPSKCGFKNLIELLQSIKSVSVSEGDPIMLRLVDQEAAQFDPLQTVAHVVSQPGQEPAIPCDQGLNIECRSQSSTPTDDLKTPQVAGWTEQARVSSPDDATVQREIVADLEHFSRVLSVKDPDAVVPLSDIPAKFEELIGRSMKHTVSQAALRDIIVSSLVPEFFIISGDSPSKLCVKVPARKDNDPVPVPIPHFSTDEFVLPPRTSAGAIYTQPESVFVGTTLHVDQHEDVPSFPVTADGFIGVAPTSGHGNYNAGAGPSSFLDSTGSQGCDDSLSAGRAGDDDLDQIVDEWDDLAIAELCSRI